MQNGCYPSFFNAMRKIHEVFIRGMLSLWSDRAFGEILKAMGNTGDWELSERKGEKTADNPPAVCKRLHQDLLNLGDLFCAELTVGQHTDRIFNLADFASTDQNGSDPIVTQYPG
ncbi:Uncharacterised protein [Serratia fonticola]|nr:Uncharacterised protein [Serratia fonticola]